MNFDSIISDEIDNQLLGDPWLKKSPYKNQATGEIKYMDTYDLYLVAKSLYFANIGKLWQSIPDSLPLRLLYGPKD